MHDEILIWLQILYITIIPNIYVSRLGTGLFSQRNGLWMQFTRGPQSLWEFCIKNKQLCLVQVSTICFPKTEMRTMFRTHNPLFEIWQVQEIIRLPPSESSSSSLAVAGHRPPLMCNQLLALDVCRAAVSTYKLAIPNGCLNHRELIKFFKENVIENNVGKTAWYSIINNKNNNTSCSSSSAVVPLKWDSFQYILYTHMLNRNADKLY